MGISPEAIAKEGEDTAHQLERMLKTLGAEIKEAQVDMFAGMELGEGRGGIVEAQRDEMDAIKAPAPPPLPARARGLAKELEKRVKADRPWAILERNVDFGNLSFEDRGRIWNYKPLREVLAQAIGMGTEVQIYQAGFLSDQLQVTFRGIPKEKEAKITKAMN